MGALLGEQVLWGWRLPGMGVPFPPPRLCPGVSGLGWKQEAGGACALTGLPAMGTGLWRWRSCVHLNVCTCVCVSSEGTHFPCAWSVIKNVLIAKCN